MAEAEPNTARVRPSIEWRLPAEDTFRLGGDARPRRALQSLVSRIFASWNQMADWLRKLDRLPRPVRRRDASSEWL